MSSAGIPWLTDVTYALLPSVPAGLPKAQRNFIVHEYWRLDPQIIWTSIRRDLPALHLDALALLDD